MGLPEPCWANLGLTFGPINKWAELEISGSKPEAQRKQVSLVV